MGDGNVRVDGITNLTSNLANIPGPRKLSSRQVIDVKQDRKKNQRK